jgi:hypothetical protein
MRTTYSAINIDRLLSGVGAAGCGHQHRTVSAAASCGTWDFISRLTTTADEATEAKVRRHPLIEGWYVVDGTAETITEYEATGA